MAKNCQSGRELALCAALQGALLARWHACMTAPWVYDDDGDDDDVSSPRYVCASVLLFQMESSHENGGRPTLRRRQLRMDVEGKQKARSVDKISRKMFPLAFILFNTVYWIVYTMKFDGWWHIMSMEDIKLSKCRRTHTKSVLFQGFACPCAPSPPPPLTSRLQLAIG